MTEAGGTFSHRPVLLDEVLSLTRPDGEPFWVDCTLGGAGHAMAILARAGEGARLLGLDRDDAAIAAAAGNRAIVVKSRFSQVDEVVQSRGYGRLVRGRYRVDGLLADIGVSSEQIDRAERGFSYGRPGPLDMRMGSEGETARELIERLTVNELATILWRYGEVPRAVRVAAAKEALAAGEAETTTELARAIEKAVGVGAKRSHNPATLPFQALRIAVNDELGELERLLEVLPELLDLGGVGIIITFHSLEDRMVKQRFAELTQGPPIPRGLPVTGGRRANFELAERGAGATELEKQENPRARSARVRAIRRIAWEA
jgi:16S rRNA (cytosine1402-N4)-methyltransferase